MSVWLLILQSLLLVIDVLLLCMALHCMPVVFTFSAQDFGCLVVGEGSARGRPNQRLGRTAAGALRCVEHLPVLQS